MRTVGSPSNSDAGTAMTKPATPYIAIASAEPGKTNDRRSKPVPTPTTEAMIAAKTDEAKLETMRSNVLYQDIGSIWSAPDFKLSGTDSDAAVH